MPSPDPKSLKVVISPHEALYSIAETVPVNEDGFEDPEQIQTYCQRLSDILHSFKGQGIGLAANQTGLLLRIFVCMDNLNDDTSEGHIRAYVNPVIVEHSSDLEDGEEGCLSFPGVRGIVSRPSSATIEYYDVDGQKQTQTETGLQARCWMHELDHLNGVNIPDRFDFEATKKNAARLKKLGYTGWDTPAEPMTISNLH